MRSRAMRDSTFYQDLVQEIEQRTWEWGVEQGRQEGERRMLNIIRRILPLLQSLGVSVKAVVTMTGLTKAELEGEEERD